MNKSVFIDILAKLIKEIELSFNDQELLKNYQLNQNYPFSFTKNQILYEQKISLFPSVSTELFALLQKLKCYNFDDSIHAFWFFWLPVALELAQYQQKNPYPLLVGILGGQGTGKTTLTSILQLIWQHLDISSVALSLDDLYKTYHDRTQLLKKDSRLIWRGPPATHDVELGIKIISQLQQRLYPVSIPRFDKSLFNGQGDRSMYEKVNRGDIIIPS